MGKLTFRAPRAHILIWGTFLSPTGFWGVIYHPFGGRSVVSTAQRPHLMRLWPRCPALPWLWGVQDQAGPVFSRPLGVPCPDDGQQEEHLERCLRSTSPCPGGRLTLFPTLSGAWGFTVPSMLGHFLFMKIKLAMWVSTTCTQRNFIGISVFLKYNHYFLLQLKWTQRWFWNI